MIRGRFDLPGAVLVAGPLWSGAVLTGKRVGHGVRNNFVQSEVQPLNSELSSNAKIVQTLGVERVQL